MIKNGINNNLELWLNKIKRLTQHSVAQWAHCYRYCYIKTCVIVYVPGAKLTEQLILLEMAPGWYWDFTTQLHVY